VRGAADAGGTNAAVTPRYAAVGLLAALTVTCAEDGAHFTTRVASGFTPAQHSISVLGVFRDGRMSDEAWKDTLKPHVETSLGVSPCDAGYGSGSLATHEALASAIDDYAREEGPTDALLEQLAPAAQGDLIAVVIVSGRLPAPRARGDAGTPPQSAPIAGAGAGGGRRGMGGRGGMRGGGRSPHAENTAEQSTLEMSVSLFSVREHRSVALVSMQYDGPAFDDALTKFASKIASTMPGSSCSGWNWDAHIDPERIRAAIDP
jgi:hypothetical protein